MLKNEKSAGNSQKYMSCPDMAIQLKRVKDMTENKKRYCRYSICFKEKVVEEVSSGLSISEVCRRYGIKGTGTVQTWIKKFGRDELLNTTVRMEMKGEGDRLKELESENRALKIAVAEKTVALDAMGKLVEIANRHYGTDFLKKNRDSDVTYIRTNEGFMYLFLLTDVYSRKIVGWELSGSLSHEAGVPALKRVLKQCSNPEGVIHHSDRGIQYSSNAYTKILLQHRIVISMTEENHCYENAMDERVRPLRVGILPKRHAPKLLICITGRDLTGLWD
jgi:transposase-like protein